MPANEKDNISTCLTLYAGGRRGMENGRGGEDRNDQVSNPLKLEKQLSVIRVFLDVNVLSIGN